MANSNFIVRNGLTVGNTTIFAGNGDIVAAGNVSTTGTAPVAFSNGLDVTAGNLTVSADSTAKAFVVSAALTDAIITAAKTANAFVQSALYNGSSGTKASSDFIAYADTGDNSRGFMDMGIASSGFADPAYAVTAAGDSYLFASAPTGRSGNLVIATDSLAANGGAIIFAANGFGTAGRVQAKIIYNDGLNVTGNIVSEQGIVFQGPSAKKLRNNGFLFGNSIGYTNTSAIFSANVNDFAQLALHNNANGSEASTDLIAYASDGDNDSGFMDMGITSNAYASATFSITGPSDGYIFMSAPHVTTGNGSMFLSTDNSGAHNDIVFSTDGFVAGTERMRIIGTDRVGKPAGIEIIIPTTSTSTVTGALRVDGGVGVKGNLYVGGNVNIVGNISFGGNGTTLSTQTLTVENTITFLGNSNPANLKDIGITGQYTIGANTYWCGFVRQASSGSYKLYDKVITTPTDTVTFDGAFCDIVVGSGNIANSTISTSTTSGALKVAGGVGVVGNLYIGGGNGTAITHTGHILPSANVTYNLGSATAWYSTFYGLATQAKYADLAENYQADRSYNAGTVLMFGGSAEVTLADADTPAVAGVVSTNPAHLMNGGLTGPNVVPLALQGRTPCNVIGPVKKGDLMVSAGFGFAKSSKNPAVGQVIGKSLSDFTGAKGQIEVVVGRV